MDDNKIIIEGKEKLQAVHDLRNASLYFKTVEKNHACMARDRARCQVYADIINKNLDILLS